MKNIGNSILPSSDPQILQPLAFRGGSLVVTPDENADTHHLMWGDRVLASHPNGYSCRELAERLIEGKDERIAGQAYYIVRCGGSADLRAIHEAQNAGSKFNIA